jgi:hypothetical protein
VKPPGANKYEPLRNQQRSPWAERCSSYEKMRVKMAAIVAIQAE